MTADPSLIQRRDAAKREAARLTIAANELFESGGDPDLIDAAFAAVDAANSEHRALEQEVYDAHRLERARLGEWPTASAWED